MSKKHTFTYICEDCTFIFQTFGKPRNRNRYMPFCPSCGEFHGVKEHDGIHSNKETVKNLKTRWKEEELELLRRCIKDKTEPYKVAILTGRSKDSVSKKMKRMKSGLG